MSNVASLTLVCDDELLLGQRSDEGGMDHQKKWAAPGGSVEDGSTGLPADKDAKAAALREFKEEFGFDLSSIGITPYSLLETPTYRDNSGSLQSYYVRITPEQKQKITPVLNHETSDVRWFKAQEMPPFSLIHPHYVNAANYIIRSEINPDLVALGKRPGLDIAVPGSEQDNKEISSQAEELFDNTLKEQHGYKKSYQEELSVLRQFKVVMQSLEHQYANSTSTYHEDLEQVRVAYSKLSIIRIKDMGRGKDLAEAAFKHGDNLELIREHLVAGDPHDILHIKGNNFLKPLTSLPQNMEEAVKAIDTISRLAEKYEVFPAHISTLSRRIVSAAQGEPGADASLGFLGKIKDDFTKSKRNAQEQTIKNAGDHLRFIKWPDTSQDAEKRIAELEKKITDFRYQFTRNLDYPKQELGFIVENGMCFMPEEKRRGLIEAVNVSGLRFATYQERTASLVKNLEQISRADPFMRELLRLPDASPGRTIVYHASSHLFDAPSEEYMTRERGAGQKAGSQFDGIGFYTTTSRSRVSSYKGGSDATSQWRQPINGIHTYVYEIPLDENTLLEKGKPNLVQLNRINTILADRGTSVEALCKKYGSDINNIRLNNCPDDQLRYKKESFESNPLYAEYGSAGTIEVLKAAGINGTTGFQGGGVSSDDRIITNVSQLIPLARVELEPALAAKQALLKLVPFGVQQETHAAYINSLSAQDLTKLYFKEVRANNHGDISNYHVNKLRDTLAQDFHLDEQNISQVVNESLVDPVSGKPIVVKNVYFGPAARKTMSQPVQQQQRQAFRDPALVDMQKAQQAQSTSRRMTRSYSDLEIKNQPTEVTSVQVPSKNNVNNQTLLADQTGDVQRSQDKPDKSINASPQNVVMQDIPSVPSKPVLGVEPKIARSNGFFGAMNTIGNVSLGINAANALAKGHPKEAVEVGASAGAIHYSLKGVGAVLGEKAVPIVGQVVGAGFAGRDAYDSFKAGKTARGWWKTTEASLYTASGVSGTAALCDCWNPTGLVPGAVALVTGGTAVAMTTAGAVYDNIGSIKSWLGIKKLGTTSEQKSSAYASNLETSVSTQLSPSPNGANNDKYAALKIGGNRVENTGNVAPVRSTTPVSRVDKTMTCGL